MTEDTYFAWKRVAEDTGASIPETIEKALMILAEHEGLIARKLLRVSARVSQPAGGGVAA
jgi:hypothetical protein